MRTPMSRLTVLLPFVLLAGLVARGQTANSAWLHVDLRPVADQARVEAVPVNVTPDDRALLDIIGSDAGLIAARHVDFLWVAAKPLAVPAARPCRNTPWRPWEISCPWSWTILYKTKGPPVSPITNALKILIA